MAIKVIGTGMYVPSFKVSNQKLESIVETTDEWITNRTGIHNRYIVTTENTVDLA